MKIEEPNPWQSPPSASSPSPATSAARKDGTFHWNGRAISITAAKVPRWLPLFEQCYLTIDGTPVEAKTDWRVPSLYVFPVTYEQAEIEFLVEVHGDSICENDIRVWQDDELIHEASVEIENSKLSQVVILAILALAMAGLVFVGAVVLGPAFQD